MTRRVRLSQQNDVHDRTPNLLKAATPGWAKDNATI
jgi:hypothetical protein